MTARLLHAAAGTLLAAALLGCGATHTQLQPDQPYWFSYTAAHRGAILVPYDRTGSTYVHFCAEPSPDVALQQAIDILGKAQTPAGVSAEVDAKYTTEVIALAGRTQTILFLREALYRLCEAQMNGNIKSDQVPPLFQDIINAAATMAATQLVTAISQTPDAKLSTVSTALTVNPPAIAPPQ